ncbi:MAG: hypothetical protein WCJ60_02370 [bacterium]
METQNFLANLQRNLELEASKPNPEQEFAKTQVAEITSSIDDAKKAMAKFLLSYKPDISFPTSLSTPDIKEVVKAVKQLEKSLKPIGIDNTDIIATLENVSSDITKELKGQNALIKGSKTDKVSVTNLGELLNVLERQSKAIDTLTKEVKSIKLSPKITVPAPVVNVAETDVKSIVKGLETVKKAVDTKNIPVANTPTDPLIYYLPSDIDDAGAVQYFGYTDNRGAWYIRKFDTSTSPKTIRFSFGQSNYATNFTNRASLTYAIWGS